MVIFPVRPIRKAVPKKAASGLRQRLENRSLGSGESHYRGSSAFAHVSSNRYFVADPPADSVGSAGDGRFELDVADVDHQGDMTGDLRLDVAALVETAPRTVQVLYADQSPDPSTPIRGGGNRIR